MKSDPSRWYDRHRLLLLLALGLAGPTCATTPAAPPVATPAPAVADPRLAPPAFSPAPVAPTPEAREDRRTAARRRIVAAVWQTVRDHHYDPALGGVDWNAVRARYEPLALGAPSDASFYRVLNQMVGELGQSHMLVSGPGAGDQPDGEPSPEVDVPTTSAAPSPSASASAPAPGAAAPAPRSGPHPDVGAPVPVDGIGDPGIVVRSIEGRPIVTSVRRGSSAERRGIRPGFVVLRIGGTSSRPSPPRPDRYAPSRSASPSDVSPRGGSRDRSARASRSTSSTMPTTRGASSSIAMPPPEWRGRSVTCPPSIPRRAWR